MDSGTDFGHPDLQGTFARDTNASSPYFDWPMAFDPNSMSSYLLGGLTFPTAPSSWYVDTSFTATADPVTGNLSLPFNGHVYNVAGIPSASGIYHLGLHPDNSLRSFYYGEFVAMLVTDSTFPGVYDTVHVDLDDNYHFGNDKAADVSSPEIWMDSNGDGMADLSGGLVYFIGDGANPIPYSDVMGARYGLPVPTPGAGDLVALQIGDVLAPGGGDHGTLCASSIVAQNKTGSVLGFAPQAKLISVGNIYAGGFFYDMFTFVGEGYDGTPGTGDEAQVASASFGFSGTFNDGWDFTARWVELLSLLHSDSVFSVSSGNGGHGFGTVTSPSSSSGVISVGASTSYSGTEPYPVGAADSAAHSTFGDVQPWSNRGPSTLGTSKPDVVTVGAWASGDQPVNCAGIVAPPYCFGPPAWVVWGGTSLSAPATAAILALVENAVQHHGERIIQSVREGPADGIRRQHALRSRGHGPRPDECLARCGIGVVPGRPRGVPLHGRRARAGMDGRELPRDLLSELHESVVAGRHVHGHVLRRESQHREPEVRPRVRLGAAKDRQQFVDDHDDERERERAELPSAGLSDQPDGSSPRRDEPA